MRLSARLVLQQVLEDEVTTWLGRDWNSRSDTSRALPRSAPTPVTEAAGASPTHPTQGLRPGRRTPTAT